MAVKLAFNGLPRFEDSNGNALNGGQLFTYAAGSSTKLTTYQDSGALVQHSNPIVLNSRGEPPAAIWLTAGSSYKFVLAPATDSDPPAAPIWTVDNITGINDTTSAIDEWQSFSGTPTYISATSFSVTGDQTSTFHKGRRLKSTVTAGTAYSTVVSAVFGAVTTVTVANDSGGNTLDSGLSAVSVSIIKADNPSINAEMVHRKATAVASSATTDIWAIAGDYVHVTGVTPITSFGTAPYAGAMRTVIFDGVLTLTNGSSLLLPGGQNITTTAGDRAIVVADTTTVHTVVEFTRAYSRPAQFPEKHIAGLTYSNNAGDATNDLDIAAGSARDSTNAMDMVLAAALTKQSDVAWAVGGTGGTPAGGLLSGAAANVDHNIWLIKRSDTGVVDVGLETTANATPTLPSNYTHYRRIGWFKRSGGAVVAFHTYETEGGGIEQNWDVPTLDVDLSATLTTARRTDAIKVPLVFSVIANIMYFILDAAATAKAIIVCPDQTDAAPSATAAPLADQQTQVAGQGIFGAKWVRTSSTGTIAARSDTATIDNYRVSTHGFRWARRD